MAFWMRREKKLGISYLDESTHGKDSQKVHNILHLFSRHLLFLPVPLRATFVSILSVYKGLNKSLVHLLGYKFCLVHSSYLIQNCGFPSLPSPSWLPWRQAAECSRCDFSLATSPLQKRVPTSPSTAVCHRRLLTFFIPPHTKHSSPNSSSHYNVSAQTFAKLYTAIAERRLYKLPFTRSITTAHWALEL